MATKVLVVYYSRTGTTRKVAEAIAETIHADLEEIVQVRGYKGPFGWLRAGMEGSRGIPAEIAPLQRDPAAYDVVAIGTPNWGSNVSSPVRGFLVRYGDKLKQAAYFCTMGGSGAGKAFATMEELSGRKPLGTMALRTKEVDSQVGRERAKEFAGKILA